MKKILFAGIGILVFLCAGMIVPSYGDTKAHAEASQDLTIDRNSKISNVVNTSRRTPDLEVAQITFTNNSEKDVEVLMPSFYVMSNDADFKIRNNINGAHLSFSTGGKVDIAESEMNEDHRLAFNTAFDIGAWSSTTIDLAVDIAEDPTVTTLAFDLDFTNPDFVIKYSKADPAEHYDELAPFRLTGNFIIIYIAGPYSPADLHYSLTNNEYDLYLNSMDQGNGYDVPLYSPYIPEGGMIRANGDIDVYIVKYSHGKRFKRLILSPSVFKSYGHLKWQDIKDVDRAVLDSYTTSDYVNVAGDSAVWRLDPQGDTGTRRKFLAPNISSWNYDPDGVYEINVTDKNSYILGPDIAS